METCQTDFLRKCLFLWQTVDLVAFAALCPWICASHFALTDIVQYYLCWIALILKPSHDATTQNIHRHREYAWKYTAQVGDEASFVTLSSTWEVPPGGWTQILLYMGWCEVSRGPGSDIASGRPGWMSQGESCESSCLVSWLMADLWQTHACLKV